MIKNLCSEIETILNCKIEIVKDEKNKAPQAKAKLGNLIEHTLISEVDGFEILVHKKMSEVERNLVLAWFQKGLAQTQAETTAYQLLIDSEAYKHYHKTLTFPMKLWQIHYKDNLEELMEVLNSVFGDAIKVPMSAKEIVVFVTDTELTPYDLLDMIEAEAFTSAKITVGNTLNQASEVSEAYLQLSDLMQLGKHLKQNAKVITYESLILPLLIQRLKHPEAQNEMNPSALLAEVMRYQLKSVGDEELEETAMQFFESNLNITETANKLFIHRNTLIYRLNKLETITGYDIRKFNDAINYYLNYLVDKI